MMGLNRILPVTLLVSLSWLILVPSAVIAQSSESSASSLRGLSDNAEPPLVASPKIIDGDDAREGRFTYIVSVARNFGARDHFCAGSLIAPDLVLFAAHCVIYNAALVQVVVEPHSILNPKFYSETYLVDEIRAHPEYDKPVRFANDFALMRLKDGAIDKLPTLKTPVTLHTNTSEKFEDETLKVIGWGTTKQGAQSPPTILQSQNIVAVNNTYCASQYVPFFTITNDMLCALNDGSCQGDSGGPLILEGPGPFTDRQVGIVSWGIGCKSEVYPGVYSRISEGWAWIRENACSMSESLPDYFDCGGFRPTPAPTPEPTRAPTPVPTLKPTPSPTTLTPSQSPSVSPAPSVGRVYITIRIQMDRFPDELGWELKYLTGTKDVVKAKATGSYANLGPDAVLEEVFEVDANELFTLTVTDRANNGMCCFWGSGYIAVYLGTSSDSTQTLAYQNGEYMASADISFFASPNGVVDSKPPVSGPPALAPTFAPTKVGDCAVLDSRGCAVCGDADKCVQKPDVIFAFPNEPQVSCGDLENAGRAGQIPLDQCPFLPNIISELCGCAPPTPAPSQMPSVSPVPTAVPTSSIKPSASPTASPKPSFIDLQQFLLVFTTDSSPLQSAWSVQEMGGAVVKNIEFGDLTESNTDISEVITLVMGTQYTLIAYDRLGNGICCVEGNGGVKMYFGTQKSDQFELVSLDGDFTSADFVIFVAQDPTVDGPGRLTPDNSGGGTGNGVGGGGVVFCFPGDATCNVQGRGKVPMRDIKLGDNIMVEGGKYEPVYSFGHHAPELMAKFIQLVTASTKLELSGDHMVFIDGGRVVPASLVKVGDKLQLASGIVEDVRVVRSVVREGAYAPFTASGALIVNGVKASTFIAFQDSETLKIAGINTELTFQFLAHTFEGPHRVWCRYFSACLAEQYTAEGISFWVDAPHKASLWFIDQSSLVMAVLALPVLVSFALLAYPMAFLCSVSLALLVASRLTFRVKTT